MLWIAGKVFSGFGEYLRRHDIPYGVFWDSHKPVPARYTMPVISLPLSDLSLLKTALGQLQIADVSSVVVAGYENYVLPAASIAQHFQVPGPSVEAAKRAVDKVLMRDAFMKYDPRLTPGYCEVRSWQNIETFLERYKYPVMLKPAGLMKSLLITKNVNLGELKANYEALLSALTGLYERYGIASAPRIILEECMTGSMHTVAGFVDAAGKPHLIDAIVDCVTGQEIGQADNFIYSRSLPSRLATEEKAGILRVAESGVQALGLRATAVHVELMLTQDGPKIIEIGARIGGYRPRMYDYACGIDLYKALLDVTQNRDIDLTATKHAASAVIELFPDQEATFRSIPALETIRLLPSVQRLSVKAQPGTKIGPASLGYRAAAVIIMQNDQPAQLQKDYAFIAGHRAIETS